ncbi:MAG: hypothetical protein HRU33_09270 [Rhodobacteraceae bacterium]|nr:hypothetical protein [Paracoccaceae bacterium]
MTAPEPRLSPSPRWRKPVAILALAFGVLTLMSGGNVLFGPPQAQAAAGNYMPFVLWFNFLAGFLYISAAIGIWQRRSWATKLAVFIALATSLIALGFGYQLIRGQAYEMRTLGALALRIGVWAAISGALMGARDHQ